MKLDEVVVKTHALVGGPVGEAWSIQCWGKLESTKLSP